MTLTAVLAGLFAACTDRQAPSDDNRNGNDAGIPCLPSCEEPEWACDPATGTCVCMIDCCDIAQCSCEDVAWSCGGSTGDSLIGCEEVEWTGQYGVCGTSCESPVLRECEQGCAEVGAWGANCGECEPVYRGYLFTLVPDEQVRINCNLAYTELQSQSATLDGTLVTVSDASWVLEQSDGTLAVVEHNLPASATTCLMPGRPVQVSLRWSLSPDSMMPFYCVQDLTVSDAEGVLVSATDGEHWQGTHELMNLTLLDLGCPYPPDAWGCGFPAAFALEAYIVQSSELFLVHQGDTIHFQSTGGEYELHNARSYISGWCDDYWNWAQHLAKRCE